MDWLTDIKKLFKEHKPKFHISTDETDYKQLYEQQKHRADELEHLIENYLYANRDSDVYAIKSEEELLEEYEKLKSR